jgi:hypothetical protein
VAGGLALSQLDNYSDEKKVDPDTGDETYSDRTKAELLGIGALGIGLPYMLHGIYMAGQAGDHDEGPPAHRTEDVDLYPPEVCGHEDAPAGRAQVAFGDDVRAEVPVARGRIDVDLRQMREQACGEVARLGTPATVTFVADEGGDRAEVASWDADACIRSQAVAARLADVDRLLAGEPARAAVIKAALALGEADDHFAKLPPADPERAGHETALAERRKKMQAAAGAVIEAALPAFRAALESEGPERAVAPARDLLGLARFAPDKSKSTWTAVYGAYAARGQKAGAPMLPVLWRLAKADGTTQPCLGAGTCPPDLGQDDMRAVLAPYAARLGQDVDGATAAVTRATAGFKKKVTEAGAKTLKQEAGHAREVLGWCPAQTWDPGMGDRCAALDRAAGEGEALLASQDEAVRKLRVARTVAAWRGVLPTCRKLSAFLEQARQISSCPPGPCQATLARARADYDRLREFQVEDAELDAKARGDLGTECRQAGCPVCP